MAPTSIRMPDPSTLRGRFEYDPETGALYSRGKLLTALDGKGYLQVYLTRGTVRGHRLIWALQTGEWPPADMQIDHINGMKLDNRWANLRLAKNGQNRHNSEKTNAISGYRGVKRDKGRWRASINRDGVRYNLGSFDTPEEAHSAYREASPRTHGQFTPYRRKP